MTKVYSRQCSVNVIRKTPSLNYQCKLIFSHSFWRSGMRINININFHLDIGFWSKVIGKNSPVRTLNAYFVVLGQSHDSACTLSSGKWSIMCQTKLSAIEWNMKAAICYWQYQHYYILEARIFVRSALKWYSIWHWITIINQRRHQKCSFSVFPKDKVRRKMLLVKLKQDHYILFTS